MFHIVYNVKNIRNSLIVDSRETATQLAYRRLPGILSDVK